MKTPFGPERLTILERIIGLTRLPYSISCLVIAVATGGPGYFLAWYLYSFSLEEAWRRMLSNALRGVLSITQFSQEMPVAQRLLEITIGTFTLFLGMYLVRYWRLKVVTAKPKLSSLSPNGETAYDRAFGLVSSAKGALLVAFVFYLLYFPISWAISENNPVSLLAAIILNPLSVLALGTAFWVYLSGLWGLRRFGLEPLNLKRFYEDKMLGLRPLGHIAVSFASTFFLLIFSFFAVTLLSADIYNMAVVLACVFLALAMLFLPLWGIHEKMNQVKQQEEASLRLRSIEPMIATPKHSRTDPQVLSRIEELLRLQATIALEDKVSRVSVWPFETKVVKELVAIIVSVATIMLGRILQLAFNL